ncbi:MAG: LLM class flavin-dependent oxidoreductase [Candidatus Thorarchaeota archaeon]
MEFGVQIEPQFGFEFDDVLSIANTALENGFSTLWFSDHFMLNADATEEVLLDPWLLMTALVRENEKIKVGSLVFCNNYRLPALHAKMGATLDYLSDGRFEFGIGAGWKKIEYEAYGYEFQKDMVRIEQLAEAIQIIRGIWTTEKFTFKGKHYATNELVSFPKPLQKPHPPIWVGTMYARDHMLRLIAEHGDAINVAWSFSPEACNEILQRLDAFCKDFGRDPTEIKRSVGFWTRFFESEDAMESAILENAEKRGVPLEKYRERVANSLWGTSETFTTKLKAYQKLGVSHAILMLPHGKEIEQMRLIGDSVLRHL